MTMNAVDINTTQDMFTTASYYERNKHEEGHFSNQGKIQSQKSEKQNAAWTVSATSSLLRLYESELHSLETIKKKKKLWQAISEKMKICNIDVTPDQVRWKINALTKKYQKCIESGSSCKFRYFKIMDKINAKYNLNSGTFTISDLLDCKTNLLQYSTEENAKKESKAIIDLRKNRLANRLESDRTQTKVQIERQWLEYLKRQEQAMQQRDLLSDGHIKLQEQELEIRKRELILTQTLEEQNINLLEKSIIDLIQIEQEKCDLLKVLI